MIDSPEKLAAWLPKVRAAEWVSVDTEADSLHAYPEKLCLIQVSTMAGDQLVDPLAGFSIDPLLDALTAHSLIMHGADYDLRLLRKHHEFVPGSIFDTMLAARLLGQRQFGLGNLVEHYLGDKLEKGAQKANWARRPLTERMIEYARKDTHYLKPLSDRLRADLKAAGRLAWHEESCARLVEESTRLEPVDEDFVWRVKGSHVLSRPALAVLRELWRWREREAIAANKPPFFILSHELMVKIASAAAGNHSVEALLPRHLSERRRAGLGEAVREGLAVPLHQYPEYPRRNSHRPTEAERLRYADLEKCCDARAGELDIDATLIASRGTLNVLAHNWEQNAGQLMAWQRDLLKP